VKAALPLGRGIIGARIGDELARVETLGIRSDLSGGRRGGVAANERSGDSRGPPRWRVGGGTGTGFGRWSPGQRSIREESAMIAPAGDKPGTPAVRSTRQKAAITTALNEADAFMTAQELHESLRRRGDRVGLATVYRVLQALADAGTVDVLRTPEGEMTYRRCSQGHHHHLICRVCWHTVEVDGPAVERWADKIAAEHGFTDVSHTLEVFGVCSSCAGKR
jgi:Fur family ferric uptake transcriptional regulator